MTFKYFENVQVLQNADVSKSLLSQVLPLPNIGRLLGHGSLVDIIRERQMICM